MEKAYRTVKSAKFTGTVSRKAVATAVRTLSEGKNGAVRSRDAVGSFAVSACKVKGSALTSSRPKKK